VLVRGVMTMRSCFTLLFAAGCLSGCTSFVKYSARPISAEHAARDYSARTMASLGLPQGRALGFADLAKAAMAHHPDIEVARAEAEVAQAGLKTADVRPNPVVGFTPTRVTPQDAVSPWVAGFTLDVPIETAHKRARRVEQARATANAAALRVADVAWQVRGKLRKAWLDLFAATRRNELLKTQLATQQSTVSALETRVKAGESSRPEVMQARLLMNQTRLLVSGAERQIAEARADLAAALSLPAEQLKDTAFDFAKLDEPASPASVDKLRRSAMTQRSDVLAALADYAVAEAALRLEIAKQYPDVHLGPGYEFDQGPNKWTLGFTVTLPVFDRNRGPIAEAEAKRKQAAAKVAALEAKISGELDHALASHQGALKQWQTAAEMMTDAKKQSDSAEALRKGGEGDRLAVLTAEVEQQAAALARLEALVEVQRALAAIEDAAQLSVLP
jgi:outer membrane protein TolC